MLTPTLLLVLAPAIPTFYAKPYLQLGNDSQSGAKKSVAVVWHCDLNVKGWSVRSNAATVSQIQAREFKGAGIRGHRILSSQLGGLEPGKEYWYEVRLNDRVFRSTFVAPKGPRQQTRIAINGDTGENSRGQRALAYELWRAKPDLYLNVGDIVYPHGRAVEYQERWWPIMNADTPDPTQGAPILRSIVSVGTAGNHDTAYRDVSRRKDGLAYYAYWHQPLNGPVAPASIRGDKNPILVASGNTLDRNANFTFWWGNSHFVVLDSNTYLNWKSAPLRAWLDQALEAGRTARWKFVVFHHPPYHSSAKKADERYMTSIADLMTKHGVDVVFSGHVHNYQRSHPISVSGGKETVHRTFSPKGQTKAPGTIYVVTGAGGAPLYDQAIALAKSKWKPFTAVYKQNYSFTLMELLSNTATFRQVDAQGKEIDRFTLVK